MRTDGHNPNNCLDCLRADLRDARHRIATLEAAIQSVHVHLGSVCPVAVSGNYSGHARLVPDGKDTQ